MIVQAQHTLIISLNTVGNLLVLRSLVNVLYEQMKALPIRKSLDERVILRHFLFDKPKIFGEVENSM